MYYFSDAFFFATFSSKHVPPPFFVVQKAAAENHSAKTAELNLVDTGNPLPRDLDPALLWYGTLVHRWL